MGLTVTLTCPYPWEPPDGGDGTERPHGPYKVPARKIKVKLHRGVDERGRLIADEEDGLEVNHEDAACPDCGRVGAGDGSVTIEVV